MSTLRMTGDLRRQLILAAAKRCFARHGFAGTTTKSIAAAASISEGLLFKHFPTKSALYAEILTEECKADPAMHELLERAVAAGDAKRIGSEPLNLFWFAHHTLLMVALARLPSVPCQSYGNAADLERQLCEFILRGIGLNETAIASHLDRELSPDPGQPATAEGA